MVALNFNAATVEPQKAFEPLPAGWYNVMIDESEMKPTKDTKGAYLNLRLNVMEGEFANRKVFCRLNLQNANATAVEIAEGHLSAICHAVGVIQCETSEMLHGLPFQVKLSLRPPKDDYEASNDCKAFKACDEGAGAAAGGAADGGSGEPAWTAGGGDDGADAGDAALEQVKEEIKEVTKEVTGAEKTGTVIMNEDSDYTYAELLENDFNDQEMIDGGYATLAPVEKKAPAKKAPAKKAPAKKAPAKAAAKETKAADTTVETDETGTGEKPPWVKD